jgi:hypothetical protein
MPTDHFINKLISVTVFLFLAMNCQASEQPRLLVRVAGDAIYHGVSETNDKPVVAINSEYSFTPNIVVGAQFQQVLVNSSTPRERNFSVYLGYDKTISENWLSSTYVIHRKFPKARVKWDYTEFLTRISHRGGWSLDVSYSPDYYSSNLNGTGASLQFTEEASKNWYWRAQLGNFNIPSLLSYQYAEFAIGGRSKSWTIELSYNWVSDTLRQTRVGNIQSPMAMLSVNYVAL